VRYIKHMHRVIKEKCILIIKKNILYKLQNSINLLYCIYICFGVCGAILSAFYVINLQKPGKEKFSPYECGFESLFIKRGQNLLSNVGFVVTPSV